VGGGAYVLHYYYVRKSILAHTIHRIVVNSSRKGFLLFPVSSFQFAVSIMSRLNNKTHYYFTHPISSHLIPSIIHQHFLSYLGGKRDDRSVICTVST